MSQLLSRHVSITGHDTPRLLNRTYGGRSWPGYVVPTTLLADVIEKHAHQYLGDVPPGVHVDLSTEDGWRDRLAEQVAQIRRSSYEAAIRRLHDVTHRKSKIVSSDYADATCLALGLDMDVDTNLPTLPGNMRAARECVIGHAEDQGFELDDIAIQRHAHTAMRLSLLIISYPHNSERLRNLAPFNCLHPYR